MKTTLKNFIPVILILGCLSNQKGSAQSVYAVSADAMNVLYIGLDNPVTVAVAGIPADKISVSIDIGTIEGVNGKYIVKVSGGKEATIEIFSQGENGEKKSLGNVKFRVKPVPSPVPTVYGKRGTNFIKLGELQFVKEVVATLDNFEFELKFPVVSFEVSMNLKGLEITESTTGPFLNERQKALISKAEIGSKIYFEKVRVQKPDGQVVDIGSVSLKVIE